LGQRRPCGQPDLFFPVRSPPRRQGPYKRSVTGVPAPSPMTGLPAAGDQGGSIGLDPGQALCRRREHYSESTMTCLSCCSQTKRRSILHRLREHLSRSSALTLRALSTCSVWCGPLDGPCGPSLACFPTAAPSTGAKALSQNALFRSLAPRSRETAARATKIWSNQGIPWGFNVPSIVHLVALGRASCILFGLLTIAIVLGRSPNITRVQGKNLTVARCSITARRTARCAILPLLVIFATENF